MGADISLEEVVARCVYSLKTSLVTTKRVYSLARTMFNYRANSVAIYDILDQSFYARPRLAKDENGNVYQVKRCASPDWKIDRSELEEYIQTLGITDQKEIEILGKMSENHAKVLKHMIKTSQPKFSHNFTAREISKHIGVIKYNTYQALERLVEVGFVGKTKNYKENTTTMNEFTYHINLQYFKKQGLKANAFISRSA